MLATHLSPLNNGGASLWIGLAPQKCSLRTYSLLVVFTAGWVQLLQQSRPAVAHGVLAATAQADPLGDKNIHILVFFLKSDTGRWNLFFLTLQSPLTRTLWPHLPPCTAIVFCILMTRNFIQIQQQICKSPQNAASARNVFYRIFKKLVNI